ncbi:hypothetical protein CXB42_13240 [Pseudomonas syringae pv. syringae]|uniref:Uncharacterized protein n=1 Tax=Pseudomonas syringae pv. syringae TaxID=321 RepID=A0AAE5S6V5_PSESY|nr:hypothetical protein CXB42_13240 [Pseudomonas syringae pv. syringae]
MRDQSEQSPWLRFRPDFVGFLRPVTYVALCVVRAIVVEKHFCGNGCGVDYRWARSSVGMPVLTLRVTHLRGSVKIKTGPRPLPLKKPENPC